MADLPKNIRMNSIPHMSDKNLTADRIGCAAGDTERVFREHRAEGYETPPVAPYCAAVVSEAMTRGNSADLYSRMHPGKAADELTLIIQAATQNKNSYVNVEGVTKDLDCELAYDAGSAYGFANPDAPIAANTSDEKIGEITWDCYDRGTKTPPINGFIAGARNLQRVLKGEDVSEGELGNQSHVTTPADQKVAKGNVVGD